MRKRTKWLGLILLTSFAVGCVTISKDMYQRNMVWDTVPAGGYIDANVHIESDCSFTAEYTKLWRDWMNTDETIANYKRATCERITEDMIKSRIFTRVDIGTQRDLTVRIEYTESQADQKIAINVIDPMSGRVHATYGTSAFLMGYGYESFNNNLKRMLSEVRTQMLAEYQAGKGIRTLLASRPAPGVTQQVQRYKTDAEDITVPLAPGEKLPPLRREIYAVVIGIDYAGREDMPNLQYAATDAKKVYSLLVDPRYGGVPKENAVLLLNEKATRNEMVAALRKIKTWDGYVYVYYSGHGAPKTKGDKFMDAFLVPHDAVITDPEAMEDTSIKMSYLQELVDTSNAKGVMVALDACFSGGGKSIVPKGGKPLVGIMVTPEIMKPKGTGKVIITSSATNEQSWEDERELKSGIFSHYLLEGMKGGAGKDMWVKVDELADYIKENVSRAARKLKGMDQNPQISGRGDFAVTRNWERAKVMDVEIARSKLKSAFESGNINADQLSRALDELKSQSRSKTLDAFLQGKIDDKKFGDLY
ncbi:MAG: caspase family protein [Nitrospirae bacterium]|nr:caspase family protein [Nitrospirota bacterium]MCL5977226.1 caspase family protein [Nitrospirota bacterium]